jgi:hypothetical protein
VVNGQVNRLIYFSTLPHLNGLVYSNQTFSSVQNGKNRSHIPAESLLRFGKNWECVYQRIKLEAKKFYAKQ